MRTRHTNWLIDVTAGMTPGLRGRQRFEWGQLANTEVDNLVRAGAWGLAEGDPVQALQIGVNISWYAFLSANIQDDDRVMVQLLERATDAPPALRCRALMWTGLLSIGDSTQRTWAMDAVDVARTAAHLGTPSSRAPDGTTLTTDAIAAARIIGDPALLLETLTIGSLHLAAIGSLPDVLRAMNAEARVLAEQLGDRWTAGLVVALEGLAEYVAGELDTSINLLRTAIAELQAIGDEGTAALFQISLSEVAELRGDIPTATSAMSVALAVGSNAGFRSANVLHAVLCWLCGRNGEVDRALALGAEAVELARRPFNPVIRAQALFALGVAEVLAGMHQAADTHLLEALATHEQVGMKRETAMDHRHIGHLRHELGDTEAALRHLGRAVELAVQVGLPWTVILAARWYAEAVVHDDPRLACVLLGNTESVSVVFGYLPTPDEHQVVTETLAAATELIGADAVAVALDQGSRVSFTTLPALLTA
jgi:tetratricopeptide (TPR) repeat protein